MTQFAAMQQGTNAVAAGSCLQLHVGVADDGYVGRWSRLFVPIVLAAAEVAKGYRVLDVSTGTGEAALMALPIVGSSGVVIGADISSAMLEGARRRLSEPSFWPVAADGQALPFPEGGFEAVVCQLGCSSFPSPLSDEWSSDASFVGEPVPQYA